MINQSSNANSIEVNGIIHNFYTDTNGHVIDVYENTATGAFESFDLYAAASGLLTKAPAVAVGDPFPVIDFFGSLHVFFVDAYNTIADCMLTAADLASNNGNWQYANLMARAPAAADYPPGNVANYGISNSPIQLCAICLPASIGSVGAQLHIFYQDVHGSLSDIFFDAVNSWQYQNITGLATLLPSQINNPEVYQYGAQISSNPIPIFADGNLSILCCVDGHLINVTTTDLSSWLYYDISVLTGDNFSFNFDPSPVFYPGSRINILCNVAPYVYNAYMDVNTGGGWQVCKISHEDPSGTDPYPYGIAGSPSAALYQGSALQVVFRDENGVVQNLSSTDLNDWVLTDLFTGQSSAQGGNATWPSTPPPNTASSGTENPINPILGNPSILITGNDSLQISYTDINNNISLISFDEANSIWSYQALPEPANTGAPASVMANITTVVVLMLENRSLDNVLGFLYPEGTPGFNGASTSNSNAHDGTVYNVSNGSPDLGVMGNWYHQPDYDPHEPFENVKNQLYADNEGNLPQTGGDLYEMEPPMTGFAWDYYEVGRETIGVMGSYNETQLPVLHGIAKNFAVCDAWFSSVPTQTFPNRAFSLCGTSLGLVDNSEMTNTTYQYTPTIFNALGDAGKTWGIYWQNAWPASGAPMFDVFTPWLFPMVNEAPNGQVYPFDDQSNANGFMQALASGQLPDFCYLEPKWGGGPNISFSVNGNDYHPVSDVRQAEYDLCQLFNNLIKSPQWPNMLLVLTFDEHGGTYDHQPPPPAVAPDNSPGSSGFNFNRYGVRVPTILVSPCIEPGTLFGTATGQVFDHTSLIATLLKWAKIDPANAGMGIRVANAETFESVVQNQVVQPNVAPLSCDPSWNLDPDTVGTVVEDIFAALQMEPLARPMLLADFRALVSTLE